MRKAILLFSAIIMFSACTRDSDFETGKAQLEQQGYTDIKNTGYAFACCSDGDNLSTGFTCKNKLGKTVTGCMCSAFLKGITIRFD